MERTLFYSNGRDCTAMQDRVRAGRRKRLSHFAVAGPAGAWGGRFRLPTDFSRPAFQPRRAALGW